MTILGVGRNLVDRYQVGERLTLETDIIIKGKTTAYGLLVPGRPLAVLRDRAGYLRQRPGQQPDKGRPDKSYAEIALTEPWACVVAAYALKYRTGLKDGGTTWIIGTGAERPYTISSARRCHHPAGLLLTDVPANFSAWLRVRAAQLGVEVTDVSRIEAAPVEFRR